MTSSSATGTPSTGQDADSNSSYNFQSVPRYVQYTSPVSLVPPSNGPGRGFSLPLNLIALIVENLDDIADIARVTRTSRLLYYMTLPQLYRKVELHSYPGIRYVCGRPEGFGGGSPFIMALNGFVTKPHANLVQELRVWGKWRELGNEDYAEGRVPDNNMMLNILLRAATDKMTKLQSFSWELDCKPQKTLYQGLSGHNTLTSLTLKFPGSRCPRPAVIIPPMANLRALKVTDIDPLAYPDDLSMLLFGSKKLEDLRLHFSPRMRQQTEISLNIDTYFSRCQRANYKLPLKHFAMQNFYGPHSEGLDDIFDMSLCRSCTFLDVFGGGKAGSGNRFIDATWLQLRPDLKTNFLTVRCNEQSPQHVGLLSLSSGMQSFYFVNARSPENMEGPQSPITPRDMTQDAESTALGKQYLHAISRNHGSTLKKLLLCDHWGMTEKDLSEIIHFCPKLEQLGLAIDADHASVRAFIPFLPKLRAVRFLRNQWLVENLDHETDEERIAGMGRELYKAGTTSLKWVGVGDRCYRVGGIVEVAGENGVKEMRRHVSRVSREAVQHVEIWGLDCLDVAVDPIAPFDP